MDENLIYEIYLRYATTDDSPLANINIIRRAREHELISLRKKYNEIYGEFEDEMEKKNVGGKS